MARKSPLKVFRTSIGFHDAYVAAPSKAAALRAWNSDKDLFAAGMAELVTDPALAAAALAAPGTVVKRPRGTLAEHLRAAGPAITKSKPAKSAPARAAPPKPPAKPKPRPGREALDKVEAELETAKAAIAAELAELNRREEQLRKERRAIEARQRRTIEPLERRQQKARADFERAMERWRSAV